ncbi:hypothetical protein NDU88_000208 [Pleurodeles waltl]|uniref:Uncharacterized protein n=1 Tax=Pleurodeles waltl TaxID=8319 RepID=A0AAV7UQZ6_PLEWA|nr:hypothetical protein NDU88_000208 [Pleurodeles waltl]
MLNKVQSWAVDNGALHEVNDRLGKLGISERADGSGGNCEPEVQELSYVRSGEYVCHADFSEVILQPRVAHGQPGCDNSSEENDPLQHNMLCASAVWIPVGVRAPSGHWSEVRAGSGATCSTLWDLSHTVLEPDRDAGDGDQLSTRWGAANFVGLAGCEEDNLDYDEVFFLKKGEIVEEEAGDQLVAPQSSGCGQKVNKPRSASVLQTVVWKTVQRKVGDVKNAKRNQEQ